jgi:demethylmenaquinone methyltransferase/2-methoxy-6-polyprenyl-1,4-benzoquinol methylase
LNIIGLKGGGCDNVKQRRQTHIIEYFEDIAPRYDFLNHLLSMGRDRAWRKIIIRLAKPMTESRVLDACTGTGDMALLFAREPWVRSITGVDLSPHMLRKACKKASAAVGGEKIRFLEGDVMDLPWQAHTFDSATICFGLRNLADRQAGIRELLRVLRPGGKLFILEFASESTPLFRLPYTLYLERLLPVIGALVSGSRPAYRYLSDSIRQFLSAGEVEALLRGNGAQVSTAIPLTFGIVYLYVCRKKHFS